MDTKSGHFLISELTLNIINKKRVLSFLLQLFSFLPINNSKILINSFHGKKLCSDPKLFRDLIPENDNLRIVYYLDIHQDNILLKTVYLIINIFNLATSKIRVSNFEMNDVYRLRKGQNYIQLWHGTPIKQVGLRPGIEESLYGDSRNWTHLSVASDLEKEIMQKSFHLNPNIKYVEGSLRLQYLLKYQKNQVRDKVQKILIAPSFNQSKSVDVFNYIAALINEMPILHSKHKFGFRKHVNVSDEIQTCSEIQDESVTDLFSIIRNYDTVITDISSIGIEFGLAGKRALFVTEDGERYFRGVNPEMRFIFREYGVDSWEDAIKAAIYSSQGEFSQSHINLLTDLCVNADHNHLNVLLHLIHENKSA